MKTEVVKITHLMEVTELKEYYTHQSIDELASSIDLDGGLRTPIIVTEKYEIIDGYRRVESMILLGKEYIEVWIDDVEPTIFERIIRNMYRTKTIDDQVKELKSVFVKYPKRMGKKSDDGEVYNRNERISKALNKKYSGKETISNLEYILNNDIENDTLSKGIIEKNWKIEPCYNYLTKWKAIDQEYNYGYSKKLEKGEITVTEANLFIEEHFGLQKDKTSFIIPEKCHSYNMDCREIDQLEEFIGKIQLVFTSVYFWNQRFYEVGEIPQPGHEPTKEDYLETLTKIFIPVCKTLKESGVVAVNIADSFINGIPQRIPFLFIEFIEKNTPLKFIGEIIWSKKNPRGNGASEDKIRPKNKIEYIMTFALNPDKVKYRKLVYKKSDTSPKITNGYKDVNKHGVRSKKRKSLSTGYSSIKNHIYEQEIENIITTSVGQNHDVKKIIKDSHPAIMSQLLPISIIQFFTDEFDWVYDCMAGSNVVGRCSQLLNRRSLSTEISPKYFNIGCKMLENSIIDFNRDELDIINKCAYGEKNQALIAA
jgi:DNA modification methylase